MKKAHTYSKDHLVLTSYDSVDADGNFISGAARSAAETGSTNASDRRAVQAGNIGAPSGAGPDVRS